MGTKVNSNYEDLLTFTRASGGHALRPVSYGDELVTNGTYDSDLTGWDDDSVGSGTATVSSGQVSLTRTDSSNRGSISQSHTLVSGKVYLLSFELVSGAVQAKYKGGSGSASQYFNNEDWNQLTTAGIYQTRFLATGTDGDIVFLAINNGVTAVLDNVSVKEVTFDQPDGTLTLFEHPVNVPRVEWDSAGNRLGLLVEESRTNLITYSEDFSNAYWSKLGSSSIVSTDNLAPDGTLTASEISIGSGQSYIRRSEYSISVTDHSASFWVKAASSGSATAIRLTTNNTAAWGTGVSSKLTLTSEWQRIEVKGDLNSLAPSLNLLLGNTDENNAVDTDCVGNVLVWGAQLEAGSFPTSYIKSNSGSTTTRSADVASIPTADFGWNNKAGSTVVNFKVDDNQSVQQYVLGTDSSSARWAYSNPNQTTIACFDGTSTNKLGPILEEQINSIGTVSTLSEANLVLNGVIDTEISTNGNIVKLPTELRIGCSAANAQQLNGHIKSIQYYPRRLTNAQLEALTEPRSTPTLSLTFDGLESSYTENYIHG